MWPDLGCDWCRAGLALGHLLACKRDFQRKDCSWGLGPGSASGHSDTTSGLPRAPWWSSLGSVFIHDACTRVVSRAKRKGSEAFPPTLQRMLDCWVHWELHSRVFGSGLGRWARSSKKGANLRFLPWSWSDWPLDRFTGLCSRLDSQFSST